MEEFEYEIIDPKIEKILYNNIDDPELIIVYVDIEYSNILEIFHALQNKNFVLRYKFSTCINDNEHHYDFGEYNTDHKEDYVGIGLDISVV